MVVGDTELTKAVEQIQPSAWSCSTRDVELGISIDSDRTAHVRVESGRGDGGCNLRLRLVVDASDDRQARRRDEAPGLTEPGLRGV